MIFKTSARTFPRISKSLIRNLHTHHHIPSSPTNYSRRILLGVSTGIGLSYFAYNHHINNDVHALNTSIHQLTPAKDADTFEMGLYKSSQKEEYDQYYGHREEKKNHANAIVRYFYYIRFAIEDYVIDPMITFARFLELSCIFVPVLLVSPICWFGRKHRTEDGDLVRTGATLWYRYLRWSAEVAGASFIKLGQWAASRTDIFPQEMCNELGSLHSNANPHSLEVTKRIVSRSFNLPFDEIFDEFQEKPLGVGAIAQVYLGKLSKKVLAKAKSEEKKWEQELSFSSSTEHETFFENLVITEHLNSNEYVAIKVLHPRVEIKIHRDLKIMKFFADVINVIPTMEWLSLPDEVEQFSILMKLQLDLRIEALNLAKFRENFKSRSDIHFPKPYLNFTTRDVLVEEYIHAIPLSKLLSLADNYGKNLSKEVSDKGLDAFLKMLILDNFVHADLHPGNMMVRFYKNEMYRHKKEYKIVKTSNEAETNKITNELLALGDNSNAWCTRLAELYEEGYHAEVCFLDVGLVTELNQKDRVNFIDLFKALSEFDGYRAGELMVERSRSPETALNKEIFALKVEKLVDRMKQRTFTLGNISIGDLLDQVLGMVRNHHVRMEGDFVTVVVAILLLEGIGRQLDPNLDLFASLPVLRRLGISQEGREILKNENSLSMVKVWLALEVRQFINASIQDIHSLVKSDMFSPNV
ncbi:ABC1 family protein, mitochondrial, putative [Candida maltosa Xu316]|uniref:ABC1 family protein, mitochondrial, putative n=1 Tax=Candida maltosa (strain Xu316) TaxID=1245528 RepID=M3K0Y8_CANMX|nr:ABC1 family protein, mitochondrial, putative [Candida maltosa Xu316]